MKFSILSQMIPMVLANSGEKPKLRGVAFPETKFVKKNTDGTYSGFAVDILKFISNEAEFDYDLHNSPGRLFGFQVQNGVWTGMFDELLTGKADFALADFPPSEENSQVVDLTTPYYTSQILGVVNRKHATGIKTLQDLAVQTDGPGVCVVKYGVAHRFLCLHSRHQTAHKLGAKIETDETKNLVRTDEEGFERVSKGDTPWVFVAEGELIKRYARTHPEIVILEDEEKMFPSYSYAIALPKGSPYLAKFNAAIQKWRQLNL